MIIERDGRFYFVSSVRKIDNTKIDANQLFTDLNKVLTDLTKDRLKKTIYPKEFGYPLQLLKNRFSGEYVSPSFFKSYSTNPALCLMNNFFKTEDDVAIQIGNTFHKIMEDFYKEKVENRTKETLLKLIEKNKNDKIDEEDILTLVRGYFGQLDYQGNKVDYTIPCEVEQKLTQSVYVRSLKETLPIKFTVILDRIDFREDGLYLVDYKTGIHSDKGTDYEQGYLAQMLLGKWVAEEKYNKSIQGIYLNYPKAVDKWVKIPDDIETERFVVDKIKEFTGNLKKDLRLKQFTYTDKGYFNSLDTTKFQKLMNNSLIFNYDIPIEIDLGEKL